MLLRELLGDMDYKCTQGELEVDISDLIYDSRKIIPSCVFFCIDGVVTDGHSYAKEAVEKGAISIIVEHPVEVPSGITQIQVESTRRALAYMSAKYFGEPAKSLNVIGVTGTKGKTSTAFMIKDILDKAGYNCGIIGTVGAFWNDTKVKTGLTTPESYVIHKLFSEMYNEGCQYVVMEVSSQALKLDRTYGINFDVALFTNFSPDHICEGEHASLDEYRKCKQILFTQCKKGIFNIDDESAELFMETSVCDDIITYGTTKEAQLSAFNINQWSCDGKLGVEFDVSGIMNSHISLEIPGDFNAYNAMAAMATCLCFSINPEVICSVLSQVRILGRVELVPVSNQFSVIIDYAHNEVSTRSVLETLRSYQPMHIICVYGGGGNRAKIRRYDMGEVTGELADLSILTCDNPRDEEISNINKDIIVGLDKHKGKYIEIEDRTDAIEYAIRHAELGDIILLLGKGHEDYQEIKGTKYHYTEKEAIFEAASRLE